MGQAVPYRIAVCVCTADRPELLSRLLSALADVECLPDGCEPLLVVVDNRPGDAATAGIIGAARPKLPFPVVLEQEPIPGISSARNRAVTVALQAGADLVAFIDDDDLPRPDWLARLLETREATGADLVFGSHCPPPEAPVPFWLRRAPFFERKPLPGLNDIGVPAGASTCNVLLSRALLLRLLAEGPLFRPEFARVGGGDTDLFARAIRRGFAYAISDRSEVWRTWEASRLTWAGLTRRSFRYGITRWRLRVAHGQVRSRSAEVPRVCERLIRNAMRIIGSLHRRRRLARSYFLFVERVGEAYALLGGSYAYYGGRGEPCSRTSAGRCR